MGDNGTDDPDSHDGADDGVDASGTGGAATPGTDETGSRGTDETDPAGGEAPESPEPDERSDEPGDEPGDGPDEPDESDGTQPISSIDMEARNREAIDRAERHLDELGVQSDVDGDRDGGSGPGAETDRDDGESRASELDWKEPTIDAGPERDDAGPERDDAGPERDDADGSAGANAASGTPDGGGAAASGSGFEPGYDDEFEPEYDDEFDPRSPAPGAPDDEEMPLADHVEEMVRRLGVVLVVMALVGGVVFPFADRLINFLWYSFLPGSVEACPPPPMNLLPSQREAACPNLYHPLALMFARLKIAAMTGFVAALPVMVYESYLFMKPGLYPRERRYYLASVPTSLVLAGVGVAFAYFLVLPTLFAYFTGYTSQAADIAFGLTETFNLIVMMMGFFALIFQIPLFIMLAVMMGVVTRRWLASRRIYFWGGFVTLAFLFSPDPTGMAPIMVAVTMVVLFEGTLLLLRWTGEATSLPSAEAVAARRPFVWLLAAFGGYVVSDAPVPAGYYDRIPATVREGLASLGLTAVTPLLIGTALVVLYELVAYLARRREVDARVRRTLSRGRALVWPLAYVVGYVGSPNPTLLARVDALALGPLRVGLVVAGLIVLFELTVVVLDWRQRRREA